MERAYLGHTDIGVSRVILGCGNFGGIGSAPAFFGQGETREQAFAVMDAAWEAGITTFDTADAYGGGRSESWIGEGGGGGGGGAGGGGGPSPPGLPPPPGGPRPPPPPP